MTVEQLFKKVENYNEIGQYGFGNAIKVNLYFNYSDLPICQCATFDEFVQKLSHDNFATAFIKALTTCNTIRANDPVTVTWVDVFGNEQSATVRLVLK